VATSAFAAWLMVTAGWWVLAFAPLPAPPAWLAAARSVCFGTLPNGLPDSWGWMLLVLGPLSMLAFLTFLWGAQLRATARWLARRRSGSFLLLALALTVVAGVAWVAARVRLTQTVSSAAQAGPPDAGELPADYPRTALAAPRLGLVDQTGSRIEIDGLAGKPTLVTFAYAHCTTVCPVLLATLRRTAELLPPGEQPRLVVVTLDPWRDTPASLPSLTAEWGFDRLADAHLLSGPVDDVVAVQAAWNVGASRDPENGSISHPALVFVLDRDGRIAYRFLSPTPRWLAEAVRRSERQPA